MLHYACTLRDKHLGQWVIWLRASAFDLFAQDVGDVVQCAKLPERNDPQADKIFVLRNWLRHEKSGPWLLVVDNVDDTEAGWGSTVRAFLESLSDCRHGCVIITTRSNSIASRTAKRQEILHVEPMDDEQAKALLCQKLGDGYEDIGVIAELANFLDRMPLALVQAAAYIVQLKPRFSVSEYLESLRHDDSPLLGDPDAHDSERDKASSNAIYRTWWTSFKAIRRMRPTAADLLSLMSFFHHQAIPDSTIRLYPRSGDGEQTMVECETQSPIDHSLERDIIMLRDYKLVSVAADKTTMFEMHRLVRRATQHWLKANGTFEHWRRIFVAQLDAVFPSSDAYQHWTECKTLLPHISSSIPLEPPPFPDVQFALQWANLLYKTAQYVLQQGALEDGERISTLSHDIRQQFLGERDPRTLRSRALMMHAMLRRGRHEEAIQFGENLLGIMEIVLGESNEWTLEAANDLALAYRFRGLIEKALKKHEEVYEAFYATKGEKDDRFLASKNNLAQAYATSGRLSEAAQFHKSVYEARIFRLGKKHPDTMTSANNLALVYMQLSRNEEAEDLLDLSLETRKEVLGEDHIETLNSMDGLAGLYRSLNQFAAAEDMAAELLVRRQAIFGLRNPEALTDMSNLALILRAGGKYREARELLETCAELSSSVLGVQHIKTINRWALVAEFKALEETTKDGVNPFAMELYFGEHNFRSSFGDGDLHPLDPASRRYEFRDNPGDNIRPFARISAPGQHDTSQ